MTAPFSADLLGWLRIAVAVAPGVAMCFGAAAAFTLAVWGAVEIRARLTRRNVVS